MNKKVGRTQTHQEDERATITSNKNIKPKERRRCNIETLTRISGQKTMLTKLYKTVKANE